MIRLYEEVLEVKWSEVHKRKKGWVERYRGEVDGYRAAGTIL